MDTANLLNEIRTAFWSVSSDVPVALQRTMQDLYAGSLARTSRLMSSLLFGIKSTEPGTYVAALGIIVARAGVLELPSGAALCSVLNMA